MYIVRDAIVVFKMQNCTGGVNQDCINANSNGTWKCMMAQVSKRGV